jgi:hypothetical protein
MRSLLKTLVPVAVCSTISLLALSSPASAAIIITTDNTAPSGVGGIDNFQTTGALMDGMLVTVRLRDDDGNLFGGTVAWADTGPASGAAATPLWSLSVDGDTFNANWNFTLDDGITLLGFTLDGLAGLTFFDRSEPSPGTAGSAAGRDISSFAPDLTGQALYSQPIFLGGDAPLLDLYGRLDVDFGEDGVTGNFTFQQDTDNDIFDVARRRPCRLGLVPPPAGLTAIADKTGGFGSPFFCVKCGSQRTRRQLHSMPAKGRRAKAAQSAAFAHLPEPEARSRSPSA